MNFLQQKVMHTACMWDFHHNTVNITDDQLFVLHIQNEKHK